ncbi:hypothetical protein D3C73_1013360 [compost metagenome]
MFAYWKFAVKYLLLFLTLMNQETPDIRFDKWGEIHKQKSQKAAMKAGLPNKAL